MHGGDSIITGCQHYSLRARALIQLPFSGVSGWYNSIRKLHKRRINWRLGDFQVCPHWLSRFNRLRAGVYVLHRTGPGRSAWTVSTDRESVRFSLQKTQGKTSRSTRDIYSSYIMYHIWTDARLVGAAKKCCRTWPREFCHRPLRATDRHTLECQVYLSRSTVRSHIFKCLALVRRLARHQTILCRGVPSAMPPAWKLVQICI